MTPPLIKLSQQLGDFLKTQNLMLTTAESCTGGGLAHWITATPGSSAWFDRGFVTYSNQAKEDLLAVPEQLITTHGAVSEEVVLAMAKGALAHSKADISVAITGIAGPDGGSSEKPVGTVWFGWCKRDKEPLAAKALFQGNRAQIREGAIIFALTSLILC